MATTLPLKEMSFQEKLAAMEALWGELSQTPGAVESPAWHQDVLEQRKADIAAGKAKFTEWHTAKDDIRRRTS